MAINFSDKQWRKVKETYKKWWAGELKRPVSGTVIINKNPERPEPPAPLLTQATCHDFTWSPKELIDRIDYELCKQTYLGDAFPYFNLDCFGPGIVAAFLGARVDNSTGMVWFEPKIEQSITDIHFEYDPENIWLQRIKDICQAAVDHWGNTVVLGMPDLGGILDILQVFRPGEKLLLDLYDHKEHVHRLTMEIHHLWHRYFSEINHILQQQQMGYSNWSGIYSAEPFYILQCDVSYMISPDMFNELVLPELEASINRLGKSIYHLDGPGALNHINRILEIKNLNAMQWIPGDGNSPWGDWPEVYQKIAASGKLIQSMGSPVDDLLKIIMQTGAPGRIQHGLLILEAAAVKEPIPLENRILVSPRLILLVRLFYFLYKPIIVVIKGLIQGLYGISYLKKKFIT